MSTASESRPRKGICLPPYIQVSSRILVCIISMSLSWPHPMSYKPLFASQNFVWCKPQNLNRAGRWRLLYINANPACSPQQTNVAPPVSIASISASVYGERLNLAGRSLRSKYSPLAGVTGPSSRPGREPNVPSLPMLRPSGPCCCACWR